nr:MAG TPA: hypothetical protein [Caudoviricetes sp.]
MDPGISVLNRLTSLRWKSRSKTIKTSNRKIREIPVVICIYLSIMKNVRDDVCAHLCTTI